ncbi:MAG: acetylglutamate kinase [Legionellales bacterium]|nr:acetylglutamate kinase [Legionellales bacterium]
MKNTQQFDYLVEKASHLIEALPYVRQFYGKTIVIKCGGAAMTDSEETHSMLQDIALLYFCGIRPVIVHGGGSEISDMCQRLNLKVDFFNGQRVTDLQTLEVVQMVLSGKINKGIVSKLNQFGIKAVGVSGHDGNFLQADKFSSELGYVGKVSHIDTALMYTLLDNAFIPVIAPLGTDKMGQTYNINADFAASAIASSLNAEKLIIMSDVHGLYADIHDPASKITTLSSETARDLLQKKQISGGMIPKLEACLEAVEKNVGAAHIINGKLTHSVLLEMLTDQGVGTMIRR